MRLTILFILFACSLAVSQQAEPLLFKEKTHDFGEISEDGGNVTTDFAFTNNSGRAMRIISVKPSCGCTTPDWSKDPVAAGTGGFIKASFDPKGRPGHFTKTLTVTTDIEGGPMVLQIKGEVLEKGHRTSAGDFPIERGSLRFKSNTINLDKVFINLAPTSFDLPFYNAAAKPIHIVGKINGPAYIKLDAPKEIASHEKGIIKITYDAKMKGTFGFMSDNIEIGTDDDVTPVKSFSVFATLEEFFPALSAEESAKAPVFRLDAAVIDLGKIHVGNTVEREVGMRNLGKKDIMIRAIQENCSCIKFATDAKLIKPGATAKIKISFNSTGRDGTQQKAVTFYTSDPKNPVQRLTITAYVED